MFVGGGDLEGVTVPLKILILRQTPAVRKDCISLRHGQDTTEHDYAKQWAFWLVSHLRKGGGGVLHLSTVTQFTVGQPKIERSKALKRMQMGHMLSILTSS